MCKQYLLRHPFSREGTPVDPKPRLVYCYDFKVLEFALPKLTFELACSKGFYVRSLVQDLGLGEHFTTVATYTEVQSNVYLLFKLQFWTAVPT